MKKILILTILCVLMPTLSFAFDIPFNGDYDYQFLAGENMMCASTDVPPPNTNKEIGFEVINKNSIKPILNTTVDYYANQTKIYTINVNFKFDQQHELGEGVTTGSLLTRAKEQGIDDVQTFRICINNPNGSNPYKELWFNLYMI